MNREKLQARRYEAVSEIHDGRWNLLGARESRARMNEAHQLMRHMSEWKKAYKKNVTNKLIERINECDAETEDLKRAWKRENGKSGTCMYFTTMLAR